MIDLNLIAPLCDHFVNMGYFYNRILKVARELPEEYPFLEIGNRLGGTALMFLDAIKESGKPKRFLITVDPYGDMPYTGKLDKFDEDFRRQAMKILSDFSYENKLNHAHYRLKSLDFITTWEKSEFWHEGVLLPKLFGMVYFDGDHTDEVVFEELKRYLPFIHDKGMYVVDDQEDIDHYASVVPDIPIAMSNRLFYDRKRL